jgi:hypothetical protein
MRHKTKPSIPVNLDSGQRRDLEKIIEGLRKGIIEPKNNKGAASSRSTGSSDERSENSAARRLGIGGTIRGRVAATRMGLVGIGARFST